MGGFKLSRLVTDWIRDREGVIWFLGVKSFTISRVKLRISRGPKLPTYTPQSVSPQFEQLHGRQKSGTCMSCNRKYAVGRMDGQDAVKRIERNKVTQIVKAIEKDYGGDQNTTGAVQWITD